MPKRVQRTRRKGQPAIPEGAVYVGRGRGPYGYWGNPFTVADCLESGFAETEAAARQVVTDTYRDWLNGDFVVTSEGNGTSWSRERRDWILDHISQLAGKDLACWCPVPDLKPDHCHAQVLLARANAWLLRDQLGPALADPLTVREQATAADAYCLIQTTDGPHVARAWMVGLNPHLDDQAPILAIQAGRGHAVLSAAQAYREGVYA